jgi:hypothetical protein
VESAALLHDVDKMLAADDANKPLGHARAGGEWLRQNGMEELAQAVEAHPVMEIGRALTYEAWSNRSGLDGRVVAYADKRALQDLVTLEERFARWHERYPDSRDLDVAHERARRLEAEICELAGVRPEDVERLAWVEDATRAAA